jgi:plasmid stability protein
MKTTIELPESLIKQVKLRALRDGRKLKDAVADLLRKGLKAGTSSDGADHQAVVAKDRKTGLPLIECRTAAPSQEEMTPDRVAEILLAQETGWRHGAGG